MGTLIGEGHLRMVTSWSMTLPPLGQVTSSCWKEDKGRAKGVKRLGWPSSRGRCGGCSASKEWEARLGAWSNDSAVWVLVLLLPWEGGNGFLMRSRCWEGKEWPTLSAWGRDIMPYDKGNSLYYFSLSITIQRGFLLKTEFFSSKREGGGGGAGVQNSWKCLGAKIWLAKCVNCVILPAYVKARTSRYFANIRQSTKIKSFLSSLPGTFSSISFYAFPQALVPTWGKVYYV